MAPPAKSSITIADIERAREKGESYSAIGKRYGLSHARVYQISHNKKTSAGVPNYLRPVELPPDATPLERALAERLRLDAETWHEREKERYGGAPGRVNAVPTSGHDSIERWRDRRPENARTELGRFQGPPPKVQRLDFKGENEREHEVRAPAQLRIAGRPLPAKPIPAPRSPPEPSAAMKRLVDSRNRRDARHASNAARKEQKENAKWTKRRKPGRIRYFTGGQT